MCSQENRNEMMSVKTQFSIGPARSGTNLHSHLAAWNYVAYGRKRWFFIPPADHFRLTEPRALNFTFRDMSAAEWLEGLDAEASAAGTSATDGAEATLNRMRSTGKLFQCTQEAGDVVYVPTGYMHATINQCDTVGVATEFCGRHPSLGIMSQLAGVPKSKRMKSSDTWDAGGSRTGSSDGIPYLKL
jgi:hypothetical protein